MRLAGHFARLIAALTLALSPVAGAETLPLKVGFYLPGIREVNQADLKISLKLWTEEIARPYGMQLISSTYDEMRSMRQALERGDINFINAPGMEMAETFSPEELREGYTRRVDGIDEGIAVIVSREAGMHRFKDLRSKRVSILENDRLSEYFMETQCLKASGKPCREFMKLTYEKRDINSVHGVFFGRVDAALVSLSTLRTARELNPQVGQRLQTLLDWKSKGAFFGMTTRHTDAAYRNSIIHAARDAFKTPRGRQLLQLFRADYLEPVNAEALKPYWALLQEYRELQRSRAGAAR